MNREKSEPAKIIGKVELNKDDAANAPENNLEMEPKSAEEGDRVDSEPSETKVTPEPEINAQTQTTNDLAEEVMDVLTGKSLSTGCDGHPF